MIMYGRALSGARRVHASAPGRVGDEFCYGRYFTILPTHVFADLHQSVHPRFMRGFNTSFLHCGHVRMGSSFQNSISVWHSGQAMS